MVLKITKVPDQLQNINNFITFLVLRIQIRNSFSLFFWHKTRFENEICLEWKTKDTFLNIHCICGWLNLWISENAASNTANIGQTLSVLVVAGIGDCWRSQVSLESWFVLYCITTLASNTISSLIKTFRYTTEYLTRVGLIYIETICK